MQFFSPLFIHDDVTPPMPESKGNAKHIGTFNLKTTEKINSETKWVAAVHPYDCSGFLSKEEAHAYAKLLAAAPDMLQILIEIKDEVDHLGTICAGSLSNGLYEKISIVINKVNFREPRYKHDSCYAECFYLGQMNQFDLYYQREFNNHTVIARFGDNDADYHIGLNSPLVPLREAQRRAVDKGLI